MKKTIIIVLSIILLMLCGCNNLLSKTSKSPDVNDKNKVFVSFAFENASRTVLPQLDFSKLSEIVIEGDLQNDASSHFKRTFESYAKLNGAAVIIEKGTWNFNVSAKQGNIILNGSIKNATVIEENNSLTFAMKMISPGKESDSGNISLTIKYPQNAGVQGVQAGLFSIEDDNLVEGFSLSDLRPNSGQFTYTLSGVPVGNYRIKVFFYADKTNTALINTYREIVCVAEQCTSIAERNLSNLNELYTINYELQGGGTTSSSFPAAYTKNSEILLPGADKLTKSDFVFAGWFEDSACSGTKISRIEKNTTGNKTYYAKWVKGVYVSASDVLNLDLSNLSDDDLENEVYTIVAGTDVDLTTLAGKLALANKNIVLEISGSQKSIASRAFSSCSKLTAVNVSSNDSYYSSVNGVLFSKDMKKLILYPAGKNESSYTIPSECTNVQSYAFCSNKSLTQINIGSGITEIATDAFNGCSNILTYEIDSNNQIYEADESVIYFKNKPELFRYPAGKTDTSFILPSWLTAIGEYAFYGCSNLQTLELTSNITYIGGHAFDGCPAQNSNFKTVTFNTDGGSLIDSVSVRNGQTVSQPQTPVKNGYSFTRWYYLYGSGSTYVKTTCSFPMTINEDKILYAEWKTVTYNIIYNLDGGSISGTYETSYSILSETIELKNPTRNGYKFLGWYTSSNFGENSRISKIEKGSSSDIVLYAKWETIQYTITYNISDKGALSQTAVRSYTIEDDVIILADPISSKYTFVGWYNNSGFQTKVTTIPKGSTGNVEVWAGWEGTSPTVEWSYKSGGEENEFTNESGFVWKYESNLESYCSTDWTISVANEVQVELLYFSSNWDSSSQFNMYLDGLQIAHEWGAGVNANDVSIKKTLSAGTHTLHAQYWTGSVSSRDYPNSRQYVRITLNPVAGIPIVY